MEIPLLPPELIDKILEISEPRAAISLGNERVKKIVIGKLSLPRRWRSKNVEIIKWLLRYSVKGMPPLPNVLDWAVAEGYLDFLKLQRHGLL